VTALPVPPGAEAAWLQVQAEGRNGVAQGRKEAAGVVVILHMFHTAPAGSVGNS